MEVRGLMNWMKRSVSEERGQLPNKSDINASLENNRLFDDVVFAEIGKKTLSQCHTPYEKVQAGKPFLNTIAKKSQDPLKAEIARTALKVSASDFTSAAAAAYENALTASCLMIQGPVGDALASVGQKTLDQLQSPVEKVTAGKPFLDEIANKSQNSLKAEIARTALKVSTSDFSSAAAAAYENAFMAFSDTIQGSVGDVLASVGQNTISQLETSYDKVMAGRPFLKAIANKSKDPLQVEIARTVLKISTSDNSTAAAIAYENALTTMCAKTEGSAEDVLAAIGKKTISQLRTSYDKVTAGRPFLKAIAKKSKDPLKNEIINMALKVSTSDGSSQAAAAYENAFRLLIP